MSVTPTGKGRTMIQKKNTKKQVGQKSSAKSSDQSVNKSDDWRGKMLEHIRSLIMQAEPDMLEEQKWKKPSNPAGVPVWSHNGIICTGETYKDKVKLTFAKGAALKDPARLFNSSLEGKARRAIDIREGDRIDEAAFTALIRAAVILNAS